MKPNDYDLANGYDLNELYNTDKLEEMFDQYQADPSILEADLPNLMRLISWLREQLEYCND